VLSITTLSGAQIDVQTAIINNNIKYIGDSEYIIDYALSFVKTFESSSYGSLFTNTDTKNGFSRSNTSGKEIYHAIFAIQQGLIDYAYTPENLAKYADLFNNTKFETSTYFPGAVSPPSNASKSYDVKINATQAKAWGCPISGESNAARRSTGCYVAPGSIVKITVPESMVDKGYNVRVGAHSWDLVKKTTIKRLDRVSLVYPIVSTETSVANPLGGGIYIEVPYLADAGVVTIQVQNAVRSPFFSARSFDKTTLEEWQNIERKNPAPWADFESDKFMMQVPTSWIYNFNDAVKLMEDWDKSMDAITELRGLPSVLPKTLLYVQIDVMMRGNANYPGYPQSNYAYSPNTTEYGNKDHWMLTGPQNSDWTVFHELGHYSLITKFRGETEALVNFMFVAMQNMKFGMDLDVAFGSSVSGMAQLSLDGVADMWMVTENFRNGNEMNHSNVAGDEFKYQHRGYGKYVEIVDLFGWQPLKDFWREVNEDYMGAKLYWPSDVNKDPVDSRILRLSKAAGVDLRPLIHFWGIQPVDGQQLKSAIEANNLEPSRLIYDKLMHYKTIIPMNNEEFNAHAKIVYPNGVKANQNPLYGEGWYETWMAKYNESHGTAAVAALQDIIDLYFPNGRPESITAVDKLFASENILVYPNPAHEYVTIEALDEIETIELRDCKGTLMVFDKTKLKNKYTLNIQNLSEGMYFLSVQQSNSLKTYKILKI
jgi:hypothetical protein